MRWTYKNQINNFLTAVSNDKEGEIWVYGDITAKKYEEEDVTPMSVQNSLMNMGPVKTLNLRINSYGGSVPAGNAIIDQIDMYKSRNRTFVVSYIEGIAASMASGIAMAADKIYMADNALMMLHKPYTIVAGNSGDLEKEIVLLQKVEDTLVKNYMRHFKGTEEELRDLLANETWLTAQEALDYGLCDEVFGAVEVAASAKGIVINGVEFRHDADKIAAKFMPGTPIAKADCGDFDAKHDCVHPPDISVFPVSALKIDKGEDKVFEYDAKLSEYGIDKEAFDKLNLPSDAIASVAKSVINSMQSAISNSVWNYNHESNSFVPDNADGILNDVKFSFGNISWGRYLTPEEVVDTLGEAKTAPELLALAKAGMEIDRDAADKAKAYDKLVNTAIEDAIKNGVRAKGENFNDTKWKKILAGLDYDEILDQSREWDEEAKIALNAGKRVSQPWKPDSSETNNLVNPDDYSLFR